MSPIKWLDNLLFIENVVGVYRNYCTQTNLKQRLIFFQILIQTTLQVFILIHEVYVSLEPDKQISFIFGCFTTAVYLLGVTSAVTGVYYSHAFMSYYKSICRVSECFKNNQKLNVNLKKSFWFGVVFNIFFYVITMTISAKGIMKIVQPDAVMILATFLISQVIVRFALVLHQFMLYFVIMIIVNLFECLNSLISTVQKSIDIKFDEQCGITCDQFEKWVELYRDLENCCERMSFCFGRQFFFTIVLSIMHYILMPYYILYTDALNIGEHEDHINIAIALFSQIAVMIMPLAAGQIVRNQGVKFHRVLARLHNTVIIGSSDAEAKAIKNFIRLIKKNPLDIKLLSKIPAGMYMLPVIFTLAINYLITMLQFNHII